jgi:competence protein ComEC
LKRPRPNFSRYPLAWLAASFAAGIILSRLFEPSVQISLAAAAGSSAIALAMLRRKYAEVFLLLAFCLAGVFVGTQALKSIRADRIRTIYDGGQIESGEPVEIEGVLSGKPEPAYDGYFLHLQAERLIHNSSEQPVTGNIKVFTSSQNETMAAEYSEMDLNNGARIRVACGLEREERFQNPGVVSQKLLLDQQGIDAACAVKSPLLFEVEGQDSVFAPLVWIYDQRQDLIFAFKQNFNASTAGVLTASLLGVRHFLDKRTADVFREGGTFHVLVISGLHITFIGGLVLLALRAFTRRRLWPFLVANVFLWSYTFAVGAEVPVVRATVMFTILGFSQVINRNGTLLNSLGFCALLILAWRPEDLFTASFQLTFVSVAAIVVMAFPLIEKMRAVGRWTPTRSEPFPPNINPSLRQFCEALYWREEVWAIEGKRNVWTTRIFKSTKPRWLSRESIRKWTAYIFEAAIVSLVVQVWLLPFLVIYFHRVSYASVLLNLWVGPLIVLESFAALGGLLLSHLSPLLALPLLRSTEFLNWLLLSVPGWFVDGGLASFRLPAYTGPARIIYFLYAIPVGAFAYLTFRWKPFDLKAPFRPRYLRTALAGSLLLLLAIIIFHPLSAPGPDGKLHVDFLDVGQGDSALITFPDGETMLVDGGGRGSFRQRDGDDGEPQFEPDTQRIGEAVVSAFLWEKGYAKIDYILATHADADHIQGLADVAKNFGVRHALFGRMPVDDPDFTELAAVLTRKKIPSSLISQGDEMEIGGARIEVLYPSQDDSPSAASDNDHSVVLRLVFGERRILFTGDIEKAAENYLLEHPDLLSANIVKVPHHGSRTSSTQGFVDAAKPALAVISVGKHSIFGHPNPEVVERWRMSGATVLITGQDGTISVSTNGRELEAEKYIDNE